MTLRKLIMYVTAIIITDIMSMHDDKYMKNKLRLINSTNILSFEEEFDR